MDAVVRRDALDCLGLSRLGALHENLSQARLTEAAIRRREGILSEGGSLVVRTGKRTGRSPKDRFIVEDGITADAVAWDEVNRPFSPQDFGRLLGRVTDHLENLDELYVADCHAGADPRYRLNVQVIAEYAWHALFARQLFRLPSAEELEDFVPEWTVISAPGFLCDPERDNTLSETFVGLDFTRRVVLICGTGYAGEIKKSIFSVMNFVLPADHGVLPMHCAANMGEEGDVALFFGLSGTGKTTLSADPERRLIGDDEHGWSEAGVFNFEGGCYAKTIDLSPRAEPQIYGALGFGSVLENVGIGRRGRTVDYSDRSITENTRAAYPLEFIDNHVPEGEGPHPRAILFLTADAFGVLPPISALTPEQAAYYFLSGYTAKLAGTEAGMESEVEATFSECFGAPFLPLSATTYARMLSHKMREHSSRCYLVNTGWSGGPYGEGKRIDIAATRRIVSAAVCGELAETETRPDPFFGLHVPERVGGVEPGILFPRETWAAPGAYDRRAERLVSLFRTNFQRFEDEVDEEILHSGP